MILFKSSIIIFLVFKNMIILGYKFVKLQKIEIKIKFIKILLNGNKYITFYM